MLALPHLPSLARTALKTALGPRKEAFVRWRRKVAAGRRARLFARSPGYGVDDLRRELVELGVAPGRVVFVHSSWDSFGNFEGTALDALKLLIDLVGPEGTLAMPAYPANQDPEQIFDVRRTPSAAGLLTELLRRWPGAVRSINLNHSVCAVGPQAEYLCGEHHLSTTAWDRSSPHYRLKEVDALIIGYGVSWNVLGATPMHCAESLLRDEIPFFGQVFRDPVTYRYRDADGNLGEHTMSWRRGYVDAGRLSRRMESPPVRESRLSSLSLYSVPAPYLIDRVVELGRSGVTMYVDPVPRKALFRTS